MPPLEVMDLVTPMVLWPIVGRTKRSEPIVGPAEQVFCRLVRKRRQALDAQGNTINLEGTVAADRVLTPGSIMWEGELHAVPTGTSFTDADGPLYEVYNWTIAEDLSGRSPRREYALTRFKGNLPDSA